MEFPVAPQFDMTNQPRSAYRLTADEFLSMEITESRRELRQKISALEAAMKTGSMEDAGLRRVDLQTEMVPVHRFTPGIYIRELAMPAGTVIVGKCHAQEHAVIVSAGRAIVVTEQGQQEISAPCTFISPAGSKRALVVLEDTVWTTIHRTDETDMEKVEAELIISEQLLLEGAMQ